MTYTVVGTGQLFEFEVVIDGEGVMDGKVIEDELVLAVIGEGRMLEDELELLDVELDEARDAVDEVADNKLEAALELEELNVVEELVKDGGEGVGRPEHQVLIPLIQQVFTIVLSTVVVPPGAVVTTEVVVITVNDITVRPRSLHNVHSDRKRI